MKTITKIHTQDWLTQHHIYIHTDIPYSGSSLRSLYVLPPDGTACNNISLNYKMGCHCNQTCMTPGSTTNQEEHSLLGVLASAFQQQTLLDEPLSKQKHCYCQQEYSQQM